MTAPILRLTMGSGETWDDPSEDALFMYLSDALDTSDFLIVDRLDREGDHYMQVACEDGRLLVESREGDASTHRHAFTDDMRVAHEELTAWAFELPSPGGLEWHPGPAE